MKVATMISGIITFLLLLSTMICGLWLKSGGAGSIDFHMTCGILAIVFCFITLVLLAVTSRHIKKGN